MNRNVWRGRRRNPLSRETRGVKMSLPTKFGNVTPAVTPEAVKAGGDGDGGNITATPTETDAQAAPKFIRPRFRADAAELKELQNWVLWAPIWSGSKWTKRPIQVSGFGASTTNPKHWCSFDDAKQAYQRAVKRGYIEVREKEKPIRMPIGGVGFVSMVSRTRMGLFLPG